MHLSLIHNYKSRTKSFVNSIKKEPEKEISLNSSDNQSGHELNKHDVSVNEGKKQFKCEICDKIFSKKQHMNRHLS